MRFTKSVLRVGKYHSRDGVLDVTPARLKHWAREHSRLAAAKQVIPIDWDHADNVDDMQPLTMSEYKKKRSAKNTVGKMAGFEVAKDGQSATLTLEVPDVKAQQKAKDNTVYVSPVIVPNWRDGDGNEYADCITHVDFVNHPVDSHQGPFVPETTGVLACAIRLGLSKPYRMSEDSAVDDDKKDDDAPETPDTDTETEEEPVADDGRLKEVIASLGSMSIVLSDDTTAENFLEHLHQALLTAAAHSGDDMPTDTPADDPIQVADPGPTALSLEQRGAIEWAQETHRKQVGQRLRKLLDDGKCTPAEFKSRNSAVTAVKLSLDRSGKPAASSLERWIESREPVPKGTFWDAESKLRMSAVDAAEPPENMTGQMSDEEAGRLAKWALGQK